MSSPAAESDQDMVVLGRISGVFGVRGWVKIYSHTAPLENIFTYQPWFLRETGVWREWRLQEGKRHGKGLVAWLCDCDDRERAAELAGCDIAIRRDQLPSLAADDFYWRDLEGLEVHTTSGEHLGRVSHLFETGANDVLVVKGDRERLIPYVWEQVVKSVDLKTGRMLVDWDADF